MDHKFRHLLILVVTVVTTFLSVIIIVTIYAIHQRTPIAIVIQPEIAPPNTSITTTPESTTPDEPETSPTPEFIDLQPTLDRWLASLAIDEQAGVMIYDLTNERTAASYNADKIFNVASIYKLLFAYDGYQQIALGLDDPDTFFTRTTDKGALTLSECLDLTIRESYNGCADRLASNTARIERVGKLISKLEMSNTSNIGLQSTAADLTKLLRYYWYHTDLTTDLWTQLADSMLNQPPTSDSTHETYDWRQGLPAGFSDRVNVYDKVGWDWNGERWNTYADAAILEFAQNNHIYTMVVLTKNLRRASTISTLGTMIEQAVTAQSR